MNNKLFTTITTTQQIYSTRKKEREVRNYSGFCQYRNYSAVEKRQIVDISGSDA
jgi:hypothetical protein